MTVQADEQEHEPPFRWEALLDSAKTFAQASVNNYSLQDAAFFYLHAGASVELAIKAALCRISPVLLIEGGNRFSDHALISLIGYKPKSPAAPAKVRQLFTVGFDQAIKRFVLMHGEDALGVDQSEIQALKAARDVTAHGGNMADAPSETLLRVLVTLTKVHGAIAPLLDTTPEEFWGGSHSLVSKASQEHEDQSRHQVQTLLTAANSRFQEQYGEVDPDAIGAILHQAGERLQLTSPSTSYRKCPVCSATGVSHERATKHTAIRGGKPTVERGWVATDFRCMVCKLSLPTEDLVKAASHFGFDPWEPATDENWLLDVWMEDIGEDLDEEDRVDLEAIGYYYPQDDD